MCPPGWPRKLREVYSCQWKRVISAKRGLRTRRRATVKPLRVFLF